ETIALRPPAILVDQHAGIDAPGLVVALQPPQHAQEAAIERRDGDAVVEPGAAIGDAHLQRRNALSRPHVPPQFGGIVDEADAAQYIDMAAVLAPAVELV